MTNHTPKVAHGAIVIPTEPTAWTPASVGAPIAVSYPKSAFYAKDFIEQIMKKSMQNQIGCCVGCTYEEIMRLIGYFLSGIEEDLSYRFPYAVAKALEGTVQTNPDGTISDYRMYPRTQGANDGTYPALVAIVIRKYGVPLAKFCPNLSNLDADSFCYNRVLSNIPAEAFADAKTRKAGADIVFPCTIDGLKASINYAIANKGAVAILRSVGDTYWKDKNGNSTWARGGLVPIASPAVVTSGHEELLYGYDEDAVGRLRIYWLNHWSEAWCSETGAGKDGGFAWEYADVWLKYIREIRVTVPAIKLNPAFTYRFSNYLSVGMKGADVVALQQVLDLEGCYDYVPAVGSPKYTGNFIKDGYTFKGVVKFQEKYASEILTPLGLKKGTGFVGDATLKKLNALYNK